MLHGAPHGNVDSTNFSCWMTAENFVLLLIHFKFVTCITDNKALIIMDNHESHISLESLNVVK
jgi:hypothetical protein